MNDKRKAEPITDEEEADIQRQIAANPDAPEATDEDFARRMTAEEALPAGFLAAVRKRGQRGPGKREPKAIVTIRLDPDVIEAYKADGDGWQSRINDDLRKVKKLPDRAA